MGRYILYFIIAASFIFCSCKSGNNNELQSIKTSVEDVERIVNRFDNNVQSAIDSKNFNYIKLVSRNAMDSTNIKLNELKTIKISSSLEDLRNAATSYIVALQEVITTEDAYSQLADSLSPAKAQEMDRNLLKISEKARNEHIKYTTILDELSSN